MKPLWIQHRKVVEKQIEHIHTLDCTWMDMDSDRIVGEGRMMIWKFAGRGKPTVGSVELLQHHIAIMHVMTVFHNITHTW